MTDGFTGALGAALRRAGAGADLCGAADETVGADGAMAAGCGVLCGSVGFHAFTEWQLSHVSGNNA